MTLAKHRILLIIIIMACCSVSFGRTYTVQTVPNVQLQDKRCYTSNPDGILSQKTVEECDSICRELRAKGIAEVAIVAIDNIPDDDDFTFAHNLFEAWGIGKAETNNGLLILLVKDLHAVRFITGYGLEGILTDSYCKRIQEKYMLPHFREEDYDEGILAGTDAVRRFLYHDEKMIENLQDDPHEFLDVNMPWGRVYKIRLPHGFPYWLAAFIVIILLFAAFLIACISIVKFILWIRTMLGEKYFNYVLLAIGIVPLIWVLLIGWPYVLLISVGALIKFYRKWKKSKCPKCGKHKCKVTNTKVLKSTSSYKLIECTAICSACGYVHTYRDKINKSSGGGSSSSRSSSRGSSSRGSSGGSFGGGRSGGGGAGSRW